MVTVYDFLVDGYPDDMSDRELVTTLAGPCSPAVQKILREALVFAGCVMGQAREGLPDPEATYAAAFASIVAACHEAFDNTTTH